MSEPYAFRHGIATFLAFISAGIVPLLGVVLSVPVANRFPVIVALTLITLFAVGAARTFVTRGRWWKEGMEMILIGAVAASVAYGVGALLAGWMGTSRNAAARSNELQERLD